MRKLFLLSAALFAMVGCSRIQVVKQATPNPFVAKTSFAVAPVSYEGVMIDDKNEQAWLAEADADDKKNWDENRQDVVKTYNARLVAEKGALTISTAGAAAGDIVAVKPSIVSIQKGYYIGISAKPTVVLMKLQLLDAQGAVADEVTLTSTVTANVYRPVFGQRLNTAAEELADLTLQYVRSRSSK